MRPTLEFCLSYCLTVYKEDCTIATTHALCWSNHLSNYRPKPPAFARLGRMQLEFAIFTVVLNQLKVDYYLKIPPDYFVREPICSGEFMRHFRTIDDTEYLHSEFSWQFDVPVLNFFDHLYIMWTKTVRYFL